MREIVEDLKTIGAMQRHLLPREIPQLAGWTLAVHYEVGDWPGGNFYDFLPLADGRLFFLLADASEQGAPATALAAVLRAFIHSCPLASGREDSAFCPLQGEVVQAPHVLLSQLNAVIAENSLAGQSMSLFCGILSPLEGTLHFANAGHPSPRWWHARSRSVEALRYAVGLPLGIDHHATYHHKRIDIEPDDVLVLFTNGLYAGKRLGVERLDDVLRRCAGHGAEAVKSAILSVWQRSVREHRDQDDLTLMVVQRND